MVKYLYSVLILVLMFSCAQQSPLSGGAKDLSPPKVLNEQVLPRNETTNFNFATIVIPFDEYIRIKNPSKNVIVTPSLSFKPEYKVKGKRLFIHLQQDKLQPNTTYTINFSDAISDITEGNKLSNFNYVFSTGSFIDSLTQTGYVYDAFSREPKAKVVVGLYPDSLNKDSLALKHTPYYFTQTKSNGEFEFKHLKEGRYYLVAFEDKNKNLKYDMNGESVAFLDSVIVPAKNDTVRLLMFQPRPKKLWVNSKKYRYPGKVRLILNDEAGFGEIYLLDNVLTGEKNNFKFKDEDTIVFWVKDIEDKKSLTLALKIENQSFDTLKLKMFVPKNIKKDTLLSPTVRTLPNQPFFKSRTEIPFNAPIKRIDESKIKVLQQDTTPVQFIAYKEENRLEMEIDFTTDELYSIVLYPKAVEDYYGRTNDTLSFSVAEIPSSEYGDIRLEIQGWADKPYLLYLTKGKEVIRKIPRSANKVITIEHLPPAVYRLRAVLDVNRNNRWDTGDYLELRQPERVFLYADPLEIKAGWDLDIQWKLE